jgi:hypothetical protein
LETNAVNERGNAEAGLASVLGTLVSSFSQAPLMHGKRMRDLLNLSPEAFRVATVSALHHSTDPRGYRYLVTLLATHGLLIPLLGDTTLPLSFALSLARTAVKIEPQLHFRLTRTLVDSMFESRDLPEDTACRLLEILGSITELAGLQLFLRQILSHPSARIRSKAGLLIGRGPAGARLVEKLLLDENERVRANATEALWECEPEHALPLFLRVLDDPHHRVVGNAIVGLYRCGDLRAADAILQLISHPDPMFRATGVWAMGRTKDPRYLTQLARMLAESSGSGRRGLFNAVNSIKKAAAIRASNPPLKVTALKTVVHDERKITIRLVIEGQNIAEPPRVQPTGIALSTDGAPVTTVECIEKSTKSAAIGIVLPRRRPGNERFDKCIEEVLSACLKSKPKREPWTIAYYVPTPTAPAAASRLFGVDLAPMQGPKSGPTGPSYTISSDALRRTLVSRNVEINSLPVWFDAMSGAMSGVPPARDSRHLITFVRSSAEIDSESIERLQSLAAKNQVAIHALCRQADQRISHLCQTTGGLCRVIESTDDIESEFLLVYASIKSCFAVTFLKPGGADPMPQEIGIQVFNDAQFGQTEWHEPVQHAACEPEPPPSQSEPLQSERDLSASVNDAG